MKKSSSFSGSLGVVLAAAGSAVGVGNIWRFPYLCAKDGGGLFLLVYLVLVLTFGFTLLTTDVAIGRRTKQNALNAFATLNKKWKFLGYLTFLVPTLIMTYYSVIGGWITKYFTLYLVSSGDAAAQDGFFTSFITSPVSPIVFMLIFLALTAWVVYCGVEKGIEKYSRYIMPGLLLLIIGIAIFSLTLSYSDESGMTRTGIEGLLVYIKPAFTGLTVQRFLNIALDAMSQLFFSLSVSMGIMITYGSYLDKKQNVEKNALVIVVCDTLIALMAGLAVMPSRFALDAAGAVGGPKLLFITMQNVFDKMGSIGPIFGILFYLLVVFAAISSSISLLEVIVAHFVDDARDAGKGDKRKPYSILAAIAAGVLCVLVCLDGLGENGIAPATLLNIEASGWSDCWLDFFDCVAEGILMPLGALLMCICIGWELGPQIVDDECCLEGNRFKSKAFFNVCVKYITPIIMILILAGQLDSFFGLGWFS